MVALTRKYNLEYMLLNGDHKSEKSALNTAAMENSTDKEV